MNKFEKEREFSDAELVERGADIQKDGADVTKETPGETAVGSLNPTARQKVEAYKDMSYKALRNNISGAEDIYSDASKRYENLKEAIDSVVLDMKKILDTFGDSEMRGTWHSLERLLKNKKHLAQISAGRASIISDEIRHTLSSKRKSDDAAYEQHIKESTGKSV